MDSEAFVLSCVLLVSSESREGGGLERGNWGESGVERAGEERERRQADFAGIGTLFLCH